MKANEAGLEFKVGIFVLLGLAVALTMIVYFGRLNEGMREYYALTAEFANASGLLKGSDVLLSGAKVGTVATDPRITSAPAVLENRNGVVIELRIFADIKIPQGSRFQVRSSGLLGDRFVDVIPPDEDTVGFIEPGTVVAGRREAGLDDITREGADLIVDLRKVVSEIDEAVMRVDTRVFSDENVAGIDRTISNLRRTTESLAGAGDRLDGIITNAGSTVDKAGDAMDTAGEAMASVQKAAEDVGVAMADARVALGTLKKVMDRTASGQGTIGRLLVDEQLSDDLEALIRNLRQHGILFYRDTAGEPDSGRPNRAVQPSTDSGPARPGRKPR